MWEGLGAQIAVRRRRNSNRMSTFFPRVRIPIGKTPLSGRFSVMLRLRKLKYTKYLRFLPPRLAKKLLTFVRFAYWNPHPCCFLFAIEKESKVLLFIGMRQPWHLPQACLTQTGF